MLRLASIAAAIGLATIVSAVPAPGACTGACGTHDPSLIRRVSDGTYWRFTTNGKVGTASAPSISGPWTDRGSALPGALKLSQGTDIWAPDVSLVGDTYYMYYSVSSFGSQNSGIGLATSKTLEPGSWTDYGDIGLASVVGSPYNSIDPNLVKAGSNYYLTFGSFWRDIYQAQLRSDLKGPATTPINVAFQPAGAHAEEGAFVYYNGGYYYLFYSAGQCCNLASDKPAAGGEYMIKVCRSSSVTGTYTDRSGVSCLNGGGTIVLQSHDNIYAPGGQGVMTDPTYGPVLYYHYMNTNIGIRDDQTLFGWNPLSFADGWPTVLAATAVTTTRTTTTASRTTTTSSRTTTASSRTTTTSARTTTTAASGGTGAPMYGQCGGINWTGPTTCAQGTCHESNPYYSQCY